MLRKIESRAWLWEACVVSVLAALLMLPGLGRRPITTSDEARFALLARDAVERGVWLDLRIRGERFRDKPPLYPWSIALASRPGGRVTEATAQAPVALAAIATVFMTFMFGARMFTLRAGRWAALILATSYGFFQHSQLVLPDMLVALCSTAGLYALWRGSGDPRVRGALPSLYAACALGAFAKGPVGLVPLVTGAIWLLSAHGGRGLRRLWDWTGLTLFLAITAVWLVPFLAFGTRSFASTVVRGDWLHWYVGLSGPKSVEHLALGFVPWTVVLPLAVTSAVRKPTRETTFLLFSLAVPFAILLLAAHQLERYLVPLYPSAALLVAWWADAEGSRVTLLGRVLGGAALLGALGVATLPAWFPRSPQLFAPPLSWSALPLIAAAVVVGIALFIGLQQGRPALLVVGVAACMLGIFSYGGWLYDHWLDRTARYKDFAVMVNQHASGRRLTALTTGWALQLDFYLERDVPPLVTVEALERILVSRDNPLVIVDATMGRELTEPIANSLEVVDRMTVAGSDLALVQKAP